MSSPASCRFTTSLSTKVSESFGKRFTRYAILGAELVMQPLPVRVASK